MYMNGYMKMGFLIVLFFWLSFFKFIFCFVWFWVEVILKISIVVGFENEKIVYMEILILI